MSGVRDGPETAVVPTGPAAEAPAGLMPPMPVLAGPTTRLRPWTEADSSVLAAAWRDPEIRRRLAVPEPADEAAAARWIRQRSRAWAEGRSADTAIADPVSGLVIGEVGFSRFDPPRRAAMIGWWIGEAWRGQGRASEAVRLAADWALGDGGLRAVMAEIDADNLASVAVARRAGLRRVVTPIRTTGRSHGPARLLFARTSQQPQEVLG